MRKLARRLPWILSLACAALALGAAQRKLPKPGWNLFSKDQDVQLGREYAQQVERQMHVVPDHQLTEYVNSVGMRLVKQGGLDDYPYYFKVVQDDSINAFALPGGPMYVHTGLLKAVDNEAQLAGVLSHELSHVVLRHGTHQATRAQALQLGAAILGGAASLRGGLSGQLAQVGIGLAGNSVLLSFSRSMESDADLLGANTMAKAGYNPVELARFFEKLEGQSGTQNSLMARFLSDHPNPGNRVESIESQLPYLPRGPYNATSGDLKGVQRIVAQLPPSAKQGDIRQEQPAAAQTGAAEGQAPASLPAIQVSGRLKQYQGGGLSFSYPEEWQIQQNQDQSLLVTANDGVVGRSVAYGFIMYIVKPAGASVNLRDDTAAYVNGVIEHNPSARVEAQSASLTVGESPALLTRLSSDSPFFGKRETDVVLSVDRGSSMVVFVFVAPTARYKDIEGVFQRVSQSVTFTR